jgi:hypothetical protein
MIVLWKIRLDELLDMKRGTTLKNPKFNEFQFRISEFQLEHALRFKAVCLIAIAPSMSRLAATGAPDAEFRMNINGVIGQNFTELGGSCAPHPKSAFRSAALSR